MTEIDQMEAGTELDALVAEHIMEWAWWEKPSGDYILLAPDDNGSLYWIGVDLPERPYMADPEDLLDLPHFSTDIALAWGVLDKLDKEWRMGVTQVWDGKRWQCWLDPIGSMAIDPEVSQGSVFANADTPALAICRAALKTGQEK